MYINEGDRGLAKYGHPVIDQVGDIFIMGVSKMPPADVYGRRRTNRSTANASGMAYSVPQRVY